jgi:hypothetical protein
MNPAATCAHTKLDRHPERGHHDQATIHSILDSAWMCAIAFNDALGPHVIPTIYWRHDNYLYVHGARQSRMMETLGSGVPACVNITLVDGLVFARRAFNHSANYRSVNIYGCFETVSNDADKERAFIEFFDNVLPGRIEQCIAPDAKERNATTVLRIALDKAVAKVREGGPAASEKSNDDSDERIIWTGVLPLRTTHQTPSPNPHTLSEKLIQRVTT